MARSDAEAVREFTQGAGQPTPNYPEPMNNVEVDFIAKMIVDEVMELLATVYPPKEAKDKLKAFIDQSKDIPLETFPEGKEGELHKAAAQADALVDIYYYSLNAACKKGINLSAIFDIVHQANMAKRCPVSGEFLRRDDGKIIKPAGWMPPDVEGEVERQAREGSFAADAAGEC